MLVHALLPPSKIIISKDEIRPPLTESFVPHSPIRHEKTA